MIVAHHGFGEELVLYAAAGGGAGSALIGCRLWLARMTSWLKRR